MILSSLKFTKLGSNAAKTAKIPESAHVKSPRRVAAGRLNVQRRRGLTPEGRKKLRLAALADKPWLHATGPKTPAGKAKVALNGTNRQRGLRSSRAIKRELAELRGLFREMKAAQRAADLFS
jgi:hypothetical protein